ncbi:MAG: NAD(P)H-hydrate dehydratase [Deltaproteobacteria bacterium]|nr:NAD(P)H-hydrate dehydratase [Deltaproteobacteria bacterium]
MRIFTNDQIRELDKITIERYGVPSFSLMEIAGHKVFEQICKRYKQLRRVFILLGKGNNGGDGLVVARQFILKKIWTTILLTEEIENCSEDFKKNFEILNRVQKEFPYLEAIKYSESDTEVIKLVATESDVIIDALFGTGIKSELKSPYKELIQLVNSLGLSDKVISIDIPSGLNGDTGAPMPEAIRASFTLTLGGGKAGLYSYPGCEFTGEIVIIDIGLPIEGVPPPVIEVTDNEMFHGRLKRGDMNFHKGDGGHVGIIAGSIYRPGAAYLSALGALKGGAGLITLISEREVIDGVTKLFPEVMTREIDYNNDSDVYTSKLLSGVDSLVIGPGLPNDEVAVRWIKNIIATWDKYMVLDAEALKIISHIKFNPEKVVITPHPMELSRLINISKDEIQKDRIGYCIKCAQTLDCVVLLKGARSVISKPSADFTINMSGNQFMASGGMGDLLSGLIGAFIYQTESAYDAARLGAYIHGLAGDIAINNGRYPLTATSVADFIKDAMIQAKVYE